MAIEATETVWSSEKLCSVITSIKYDGIRLLYTISTHNFHQTQFVTDKLCSIRNVDFRTFAGQLNHFGGLIPTKDRICTSIFTKNTAIFVNILICKSNEILGTLPSSLCLKVWEKF